ncbi:3-hydroxyacyl-CoA dehydrogenase [Citricoccus sp. SGAir0253]|uniref:3-hydroxyacyl-CoA dehydrogenase NAD-binding domain-containing protein n=1 Tax=Citricoccus sp. SGAir0253 TaxID=2567881 RepID=UPI0010CD133B|nr:3-hydroxyacyl-CoA dehydrogenase NAD-binding domain-containing protein [Citricoccus sp. SGAir0253]QCU77894.1 3-hydroxyacyl-CoA dehydrogenase [Citricoccus sp. SGAir0253]
MSRTDAPPPGPRPGDRFARFAGLAERFPDEVVTHAAVSDHALPGGAGTLALLTLDNHAGPRRPTTLGPASLIGIGRALEAQAERARAGAIAAVALTGKPGFLVAGADLGSVRRLSAESDGALLAELGHAAFDVLAEFPVPSFAFVNGVALGGGLEIALAARYRTVSTRAAAIGLPEAHLGLVPGWGGVWRVPRITGPREAVRLMIANPLAGNRTLDGRAAHAMGLADVLLDPADGAAATGSGGIAPGDDPSGSAAFVAASLEWAGRVVAGEPATLAALGAQRERDRSDAAWEEAVAEGRRIVAARTRGHVPAPARVLELFAAGRHRTRRESAAAECRALAELMRTPEFGRTVYAFLDVVQRRSKAPAGAPPAELARPVRRVGVVGAGLMAGQLALLFARRLRVPVVMTDVDQARVDRGLAAVRGQVDVLVSRGRLTPERGAELAGLVTGSVSKDVYAGADLVIEAVFEEMGVKRAVLAELEDIVSPGCVLATNTSSLSVAGMAEGMRHPGRLIGFHVFNPVAAMPLVEVVRAPDTTDEAVATAFATARGLGKTAVLVRDAPAFVVNRVLLRLMGEVQASLDAGTPAAVADHALDPLALPMTPFTLLAMVGLPVAQHVTESLNAAFGDERFPVSAALQRLVDAGRTAIWAKDLAGDRVSAESGGATGETIPPDTAALLGTGDSPQSAGELLVRVQDALAEEIGLLLAEGVVAGPEDVDLCMVLGAGWPLHLGGITPYLDDCGASERVNGRRFHPAGPSGG